MVVMLAKRIAVALLAMAILGAPVLANAPTCCASRTAAGSSPCCWGHKTPAGAMRACCAKSSKNCCQKKAGQIATLKLPTSCCCKVRQPLPAIPAEENPIELRFKATPLACDAANLTPLAMHKPAHQAVSGPVDLSFGPRLQVLLCRWTV
jgi:hypothetical protein